MSADRHATLIPVTLAVSELPTAADEERYIKAVESNGTGAVRVLTVGAISSDHTFSKISEEDLLKGEGIGIAAALVVLLVVFGALVAIGLPLVLALLAIAIATGLASVIASVSTISFFVSNMISMIGLAVGIDYTLFIVERYREERRRGRPKPEAIEVAGGTASKAVLFSGMTVFRPARPVMIPTTIFRSLGLGAVLVVVVAVLAMLTLIPAMLSARRPHRLAAPARLRRPGANRGQQNGSETIHPASGARSPASVMARPVVSMVLSAGLLIASPSPTST